MANTRNSSNDAKQNIDPLRTSWKSLLKRINGELLSYSRPTGTVEAKLLSPHAAAASNATPRLASPLTTSASCHYRRRVRGARKLHSETEKKKSLACLLAALLQRSFGLYAFGKKCLLLQCPACATALLCLYVK